MYRIMGERPMTIRYLDPPLHEFLPTKDEGHQGAGCRYGHDLR